MSKQTLVESAPRGIDIAGAVRPGEELPVAAVDAFLKRELPSLRGTPRVTQYPGGASNWTYRLEYENRNLILRRPPHGTKASPRTTWAASHWVMTHYLALRCEYILRSSKL